MQSSFHMTRRVAFSETDAAGIAHFSNFFRWMEDTEHAFLRSLGTSVHQQQDIGLLGFARVDASCQYHQPLHFEDEFSITLTVRQVKDKSLTYGFTFQKPGDDSPTATGEMTVVCIQRPAGETKMKAAPIPDDLRSKITTANE